jgi:hypothetical protein
MSHVFPVVMTLLGGLETKDRITQRTCMVPYKDQDCQGGKKEENSRK